jgi:malonyl CoA-acyl carrier protein transacylase
VLAMQERGETRFLEVGPGKVLAGLVRRILDGVDATSLQEAARA